MKLKIILILLLVAFQVSAQHSSRYKTNAPYLVVLSMDAFRWDYPQLYHTPNLDSIAQIGIKAESLQPAFPSKTFPNHYSMATGLYPQHHGIVQNIFTDSLLGEFKLSDRAAVQNANFYGGEPIWVTAENQNIRSACYYWPGSEAPIKGVHPSFWKDYDESVSIEDRADSVIAWLQKPAEQRPHLIMWYYEQPDEISHDYGPNSPETEKMVEYLDSIIGDFCRKINALPFADSINLVFTADHGMAEISKDKSISLDDYIPDAWISDVKGSNPVYFIQPVNQAFSDSIQQALSTLQQIDCWKKTEIPQYLHFGDNDRIFDLVCSAKPGWSIYWKKNRYANGGAHGYDPMFKDMHAVFYASGPAFKSNYIQPTFGNVNLYALFAEILKLKPVKTDGRLEEVKEMLRRD